MLEGSLTHEPALRLAVAVGLFVGMALYEVAAPARVLTVPRRYRWTHNLGLTVFNTVVLRVIVPMTAVGAAVWAQGGGLLAPLPPVAQLVVAVLLLDFAIWVQHQLMHLVPLLWRLHAMHHADVDFDVSLGTRFHPVEMLLSMAYKVALVVLLGAPPAAVLLFELLLNGMSLFNHANVRLPAALERPLRWLVITPDLHRVHHSIHPGEHHRNFGFSLSLWDRLFGTLREEPRDGHVAMAIGLPDHQGSPRQSLWWLLAFPFR